MLSGLPLRRRQLRDQKDLLGQVRFGQACHGRRQIHVIDRAVAEGRNRYRARRIGHGEQWDGVFGFLRRGRVRHRIDGRQRRYLGFVGSGEIHRGEEVVFVLAGLLGMAS